ncbi:MAG: cupin domain-containing protein [Acidobacteriota bacterium]
MKDEIRSAQIVVPCKNFDRSLEFFVEKLGFRVEMIFPADAPSTAVISGYGVNLRLENSNENQPLTIHLIGDFSVETVREIYSPDGVRMVLVDDKSKVEIPEAVNEFVISKLENENAWSEGRAGMLYRDLIPSRLGGRFVASHISIPEGGDVPDYVHFHKVRFQMIYCISGWARLVYEDQGEPFTMNAGDCVLQPPEIRHRVLETSANFEVLEIGCPAIHETFADHELPLPNAEIVPDKIYGEQSFLHHNAEKSVWKTSEIEGFETRDTGIKQATDGLADVRAFRAIADSRFSVKHSDEFLFFFVLKGNLRLSDGKVETYFVEKGGSFVLPADKEYLIDADKSLEMLRVSLPAER